MLKKIILSIVGFYTIFGFFVLPYIIKSQLLPILNEELNAKVTVETIGFNPYLFRLNLNGVDVKTAKFENLISLESIILDLEILPLVNSTIYIKEITLKKPKILLIYKKNKTYNLASILKESPKKTSDLKTEIPKFKIKKIEILNGLVEYEDYSKAKKFDFSFKNIGLKLTNIDSEKLKNSDSKFRFYTYLNNRGFVDIKTNISSFTPLKLDGNIDVENNKLYAQWRYFQDSLNLEVADGELSFNAKYKLNLDDLNNTKITNLNINLNKLRIKPKDKNSDILNLDSLAIKELYITPFKQKAFIEKITLNSLDVNIKKDEQSKIDWQYYLNSNNKNATKKVNKSESKPWDLTIKEVTLKKVKVNFEDKAVKPAVTTKLNELNLNLKNITLDGKKPLLYNLDLVLNNKTKCNSVGKVNYFKLNIETDLVCDNFDVVDFKPYIDRVAKKNLLTYDIELKNLIVYTKLNLKIKESKDGMVFDVDNSDITLKKLKVIRAKNKRKLVEFDSFRVKNISVNSKDLDVKIDSIDLAKLNLIARKNSKNGFNFNNIIKTKGSKKPSGKKQKFRVRVKNFNLNNSKLFFNDTSIKKHTISSLNNINLNLKNIDSNENTWLNYELTLKPNNKGYVSLKGSVRHTPLKQKGYLTLKNLSLKELNPYIQEKAYLNIEDGSLSFNSKINYEESSKYPDLTLIGKMKLKNFFMSDSRDRTALVSFIDLNLDNLNLNLFPNNLIIKDIYLDSFYINAIVEKNKMMNLASLLKPTKVKVKDEDSKPFPVRVIKVAISNGSANFEDLSLPLDFQTYIHNLNGVVYALSTTPNEVSYIDLKGEVDKYGSTALKGSIDYAEPKIYTDLNLDFRNLDLKSMSGYSASFAGYEIDSGKMYLDLNYHILDSKLLGKNSIKIKQIKLGKEIEDENITSLPLGLAIALLEDGDGLIDINMPVEGNVDEPDFKYGAIVFKTFSKLILGAVTSPFKLIGSMIGLDDDNLDSIDYGVGYAKILPSEREKLDNIVLVLEKRPKLSIGITPSYDSNIDKLALQKRKLIALILKDGGVSKKTDYIDLSSVDVLEDIYENERDDDKLTKIKDELDKKLDGKALKIAYFNALVKECVKLQKVTKLELEKLAITRAKTIVDYLVSLNKEIENRVVVLDTQEVSDSKKYVKTKIEIVLK